MHVSRLAAGLTRLGCEVHVLTQIRHDQRDRAGTESTDGIIVHRFADWTRSDHFLIAPSLWRYLRRNGRSYDLIHAHSFHAAPALMAAIATNRPLVFTPHYHGVGHTPAARAVHLPYDFLASYLFRRAAAVVCVSSAEASMIRDNFPASRERLHIVPNGVNTAEIEASQPFEMDHRIILVIGRIEKYKQIDRIIDAFELLEDDSELIVIGDGPERASVAHHASRSSARVRLLGRVEDVTLRRWQKTASVVVSLSLHEAFGIVVAEGLAAGCAVVASDIPAYREFASPITPNLELVNPSAPISEIAASLRSALLSNNQPVQSTTNLSWDDVTRRTYDLYLARLAH
jgi:glycosyltransferase involved in cell wall biosynthesis